MNPHKISPDDPRLTAYALNEMEPAEQAEFEQALAQDEDARRLVAEIRATGAELAAALEHEPEAAELPPVAPAGDKPGLLLRFPQFYYMVSGLAAACFTVFFFYWQQHRPEFEQKKYLELNLAKAADGGSKKEKANVVMDLPAAAAPAPGVVALEDETVTLSPFVVEAPKAAGSGAGNARAGARGKMEAKDLGLIPAVARQSMADKTARDAEDRLRYAPPVAAGGIAAQKANTEAYGFRRDNAFLRVADEPLSTFSADVDTASYANVRRFLQEGERPPADAVRIEELVNYFPYSYAGPSVPQSRGSADAKAMADKDVTGPLFAAHLEVAGAPWASEHRLVRIGLKGREVSDAARPAANLVFLLDVSGSMDAPNRLPLVKQSLRLLLGKLRPDDRVAIVVYAGASGLALPSTGAAHQAEILDAIDRLEAAGSTNGAAGIQLAYDIAKANFIAGGVNRVILATDGDFNVGVTSEGGLVRLVQEKAKSGVFLTVLGFGMGNYKDATLEQLADKGNGNYAYIDSLAEAKKTLVEQAGGTLVTIAKDVKLQVEFNPAVVQAYRLIGYENRLLAREDFNNDKIDAGEIGAGHTVTALYEIVPVGVAMPGEAPAVDALKYQKTEQEAGSREQGAGSKERGAGATATSPSRERDEVAAASANAEMLTVKVRYKDPAGDVSRKVEFTLHDSGAAFADASEDFKFAAAVAAFGMELRDSPYKGTLTLADVAAWGRAGLGSDPGGYRNEFLGLVEKAQHLVQ